MYDVGRKTKEPDLAKCLNNQHYTFLHSRKTKPQGRKQTPVSYKAPPKGFRHSKIPERKEFSNPTVITVIGHEKKARILRLLVEEDLTIMDLKKLTKINPGTIKRHIEDLVEAKLVFQSQILQNEYGFKLKYYRATARKFVFHLEWP